MEMNFFYKAAGAILAPFRYAQREIEDAKENLKEDAKEAASNVLKIFIIAFASFLFLVFGSITAANAINSSLDSTWLGFAIVAGFYLLVAIGVYVWKQVSNQQQKRKEMYEHQKEMYIQQKQS
jgi:arginine exporter protein ArgO